jgi:glyoxylase-like metal-dependent hydrolase (beta-lactamase superfamily II)
MLGRAFGGFGFGLSDLHRLIASHLHVDHMGMAKRLIETTEGEWVMHSSARAEIPHYNDWDSRRDSLARMVKASGAPEDAVARFRRETPRPDWFSQAIEPSHSVEDGDKIPLSKARYLEVIYTPGHQPNHLCLRDSRTGRLYSGDHVLPRISPFIPFTGEDHDHLAAYLASLDRIVELDARDTFPGHGPTIERGSARAHQIRLHHQRRLDTMLGVLAERPRTPWDVTQTVFRPNLSPPGGALGLPGNDGPSRASETPGSGETELGGWRVVVRRRRKVEGGRWEVAARTRGGFLRSSSQLRTFPLPFFESPVAGLGYLVRSKARQQILGHQFFGSDSLG